MGICSSYVGQLWWPHAAAAAVAMLLISVGSSVEGVASCVGNQCYPSSGTPIIPDGTADMLVLRERCLSACIANFDEVCGCSYTVQFLNQGSPWPYAEVSDIEEEDCRYYQKLMDCQRGCIFHTLNPSFTKINCRTHCIEECNEVCNDTECQNDTYDGSECTMRCVGPSCSDGCIIDLPQSTESIIPPSPTSSPVLTPIGSNVAGQYMIEPGSQSHLDMIGSGDEIQPTLHTSFLLKVENTSASYFTMVQVPGDVVDLEFLACQSNVTVSIAAVNMNGMSEFSPPSKICVFGETRYPETVEFNSISYTVVEDYTKPKTPIVTVSWDPPEGLQYLTHYELRFISQTCWTFPFLYEVNKLATNFTLRSTSSHPLQFGCGSLYFQIFSEPHISHPNLQKVIELNLVTENAPDLILNCGTTYNKDGTMDVFAYWQIPKEALIWLPETITSFEVVPWLFNINSPTSPLVKSYTTIILDVDEAEDGIYLATVHNLDSQQDDDFKYRMRVYTTKNESYFWRKVPDFIECFLDAFPKAPVPVNASNIVVSSLVFTDSVLELTAVWDPPAILYGSVLRKYEIRIGRNYLAPLEETEQNQYAFVTTRTTNNITVNTDEIYQIDQVTCLYLQIRTYNEFVKSEWSDPVVLAKYPEADPNCMGLVPSKSPFSPPIVDDGAPPSVNSPSSSGTFPAYMFGVVAASFVGVLLLCVLGSVATVLCRRYRRRNRYLEAFKDINDDPMYIKGARGARSNVTKVCLLESPKLDAWEIPASQVIIEERLGEGCFGEVYKGMIKGPISNSKLQSAFKNSICPTVAIKLLKSSASGSERTDFIYEIDTMKKVAEGNNPHVVNMVGCVTIQEPLCLITEFVKHGDLLSYLNSMRKMVMEQKRSGKTDVPEPYLVPSRDDTDDANPYTRLLVPNPSSEYAELGELDAINLLSFAYQIASGMEYLSSLGIVHRDLACRNILVGEGKSLKISDFGMSREVGSDEVYVKSTKGRLPWKWMAIESIVNREFTTYSDVWSYGVALWEIATLGGFPYPSITNTELLEHLEKGHRLEKPKNCSAEVYEIMDQCWSFNPKDRPTFSELRASFDTLISAQKDHMPYIDLEIDSHKPYYNHLCSDSSDDDEEKALVLGTNLSSAEQTTLPIEIDSLGYSLAMRLENTSGNPEPVTNAYVDTPTFPVSYDGAYDLPAKSQSQNSLDKKNASGLNKSF